MADSEYTRFLRDLQREVRRAEQTAEPQLQMVRFTLLEMLHDGRVCVIRCPEEGCLKWVARDE